MKALPSQEKSTLDPSILLVPGQEKKNNGLAYCSSCGRTLQVEGCSKKDRGSELSCHDGNLKPV